MQEQKGQLRKPRRGRRIWQPTVNFDGPPASMHAQEYDPNYIKFFECFNRQQFFEAHEVLEALWLPQRQGPNGAFYKGLIQLAGAFVHLQKNRLGPAAALFKLTQSNLQQNPSIHEGLGMPDVLDMIEDWLRRLKAAKPGTNPYSPASAPRLRLHLHS